MSHPIQVVLGDFAMSLSEWRYFIERNELMDFVTTSSDYLFLALTPQPAPVDLGVFTRPFKQDAWALIATTIVVMLVVTLLPYTLFPNFFEDTQGYRMVHVISMLFFVLINSFYGGAMTMFFTSEIALPFETMRDVMRDHSWKLVVQNGKTAAVINGNKVDTL